MYFTRSSTGFFSRPIHRKDHVRMSSGSGKCFLVGSGPGPEDLLTIRAVNVIQQADVILYDDLGTQDVLSKYSKPDSSKVYVGKRGGKASIRQDEIDELLVEHCRKGHTVVRLKGGCPAVFSRVASEMNVLKKAGIPFELVPGVSSALAGPLFAGFPLTHASLSRSFAVTSAHQPLELDWPALRGVDTLVLLMVGSGLRQVVEQMKMAGWEDDVPVAIIRSAGLVDQQVWVSDLSHIVTATQGVQLSPAIMVVGQVVLEGLD